MTLIGRDDLELLAGGFTAALRDASDAGSAVTALVDLGWHDVLVAAPAQALAAAFPALGTTGSDAGLLDDVVLYALGLAPTTGTAVVFPAPGGSAPPATRAGRRIVIDGVVSSRMTGADRAVVALRSADGVDLLAVDVAELRLGTGETIDPTNGHRRMRLELEADAAAASPGDGSWDVAVSMSRVAVAHQLVAAARVMLGMAHEHAVDRVQFGRTIASFQAVRHKLAESFVAIEGAAAVLDQWADGGDPLHAALAKSLAGQAARITATHAQQVLAGIGFTTDHRFHRWFKRTLVLDALFDSASSLPAEIGSELLARRDAPRLVEL